MSTRSLSSSSLIALLALAACNSGRGKGTGNTNFGDGGVGGNEGPQSGAACAKMDLLFIVDDSGSMKEEQANLATNFPKFIALLDSFQTSAGQQLDYRIGVTTTGRDVTYTLALPAPFPTFPPSTELGDNGKLRNRPDCGMVRPWIERNDPDVATTFSCLAQVGTSGPSLEMPLNSIKLALGDRVADGTNVGFLRDDALLATIIMSDEDDCSREDDNFTIASDSCTPAPAEVKTIPYYLDFLDGVKKARGRWAAAVIAGPGPGDCMSGFGSASQANRLRDFVDQAGDQAIFSSICAGDLTNALKDALGKFTAACEAFTVL